MGKSRTWDMIDHCIVVCAVVVVLTCVMWWLQWLNTISIIAQVIVEMRMLWLVKDCNKPLQKISSGVPLLNFQKFTTVHILKIKESGICQEWFT